MQRISERDRFDKARLARAATNLLGLGASFSIGPWVLGHSVFGTALLTLMPLGLSMATAGGLLLWLSHAANDSIAGGRGGPEEGPAPGRTPERDAPA